MSTGLATHCQGETLQGVSFAWSTSQPHPREDDGALAAAIDDAVGRHRRQERRAAAAPAQRIPACREAGSATFQPPACSAFPCTCTAGCSCATMSVLTCKPPTRGPWLDMLDRERPLMPCTEQCAAGISSGTDRGHRRCAARGRAPADEAVGVARAAGRDGDLVTAPRALLGRDHEGRQRAQLRA